jgi:hypothetical protein
MVPGQKEARKVVPYSKHKSKCLINPFASHPYKGATDRHKDCHFCHAVINCREKEAVESEGNEKRARSSLDEARTNANEECSPDRSSNSYHLDLTTPKMTLKAMEIFDNDSIFAVSNSVRRCYFLIDFLIESIVRSDLIFNVSHDARLRFDVPARNSTGEGEGLISLLEET